MNRFEIWLWENERLADALITVVLLGAMALAGIATSAVTRASTSRGTQGTQERLPGM